MAGVEIVTYRPSLGKAWDSFIDQSKNGTFLFHRDYAEYHADRFTDHSLLARVGEKIVAVLPANRAGEIVQSHGGLTFGGIISDRSMDTSLLMEVFEALVSHLRDQGVSKLVYKRVPHIYHSVPADEDLYALFRQGAKLVRRDVSSTIDMRDRIAVTKARRHAIGKAKAAELRVVESREFEAFMEIETRLLSEKHRTKPTHSGEEMELLAGRFPRNIRLFEAQHKEEMVAGVIVYESANVAHTQYIASTKEGQALHAVDLILDHLINQEFGIKRYFDFGISTEKAGQYLNEGLVEFKESHGARAIAYDSYELNIAR